MGQIVTSANAPADDEFLRRLAQGIGIDGDEEDGDDYAEHLADFRDVTMRRLTGWLMEIKWQAEKALEQLDDEEKFPKGIWFHELNDEQKGVFSYAFNQIKNMCPTDI